MCGTMHAAPAQQRPRRGLAGMLSAVVYGTISWNSFDADPVPHRFFAFTRT